MTRSQNFTPTRRGMIAGAVGLGALGGMTMAAPSEAALGDPTIPADDSAQYFLYLTGITGMADERDYATQIPLLTWGWGAKNSTDPVTSGGGGAVGKSSPEDLVVVAKIAIQSPKLVDRLNRGTVLTTARLSATKPVAGGGTGLFKYLSLTFTNVVVTDYDVTPAATDGYPLEVVHMKFTKVSYSFIPQQPSGQPGTAITYSYDYRGTPGA